MNVTTMVDCRFSNPHILVCTYLQRAFFIEPLGKFCIIQSSDLELFLWVMHGNHCNISCFSSQIVDLQQVLICLICEKYHSASALVITYRVQAMTRRQWMFGKVCASKKSFGNSWCADYQSAFHYFNYLILSFFVWQHKEVLLF